MSRWIEKEAQALVEIRKRLAVQLAEQPAFPEVVGDRRLLRFLRGKQHNLEESIEMISNFLTWRKNNSVDNIRQDIVYGGKNTPFLFPGGQKIIDLAPQIIISPNALDNEGRPLAFEAFDFNPKEVLKQVTIAEYLVFLTYSLEYRSIILEQMSHEREQRYLAEHPNLSDRVDGYGVILMDFTIRDLKGVGLSHLGSEGRQLVGEALKLGLDNYQEYLGKGHFINVPWIFTAFWYFVRSFLDEFTLAKLSLSGSSYMDTLLKDMPLESIPVRIGGKFELYNEAYEFDVSEGGPLHCTAHGAVAPLTSSAITLQPSEDTTAGGAIISDIAAAMIEEKPPTYTSSEVEVLEHSRDLPLSEESASALNSTAYDDAGEEIISSDKNESVTFKPNSYFLNN